MLVSSLGISGVFFISAVTSVLGALFTLLLIPRTKNKSMYELEMLFTKSEKNEKNLKEMNLFDPKLILKSEQDPIESCGSVSIKQKRKSVQF